MKFTDRFVLVPHERYQRYQHLLKNPQCDKVGEKKPHHQKGGSLSNPPPTSKKVNNPQIQTPKKEDKTEKYKNKKINKSDTIKKQKHSTPQLKYPLPPPGIPNKPKSIDFEWISLF